MNNRAWRRLSEADRAEMWRRWKAGESVAQISRALGRRHTTLHRAIQSCGGIAPTLRRRAERALTLAQREEISLGICARLSIRAMALQLGKSASSVSREIRRNGGRDTYRAAQADAAAWQRAHRPKPCKLATQRRLCRAVAQGLQQCWSPEQIAKRLEQQYPNDHSMRVSHETITAACSSRRAGC